jgi:hypothetical protein
VRTIWRKDSVMDFIPESRDADQDIYLLRKPA